MMYLFFTLWTLLVVAVSMLFLYYFTNRGMKYDFQHYDELEMPYVTVNIQDIPMNLLIDTGCTISMLNKPSFENHELLYQDTGKRLALTAVTSQEVVSNTIIIKYNIGKKEVEDEFFVRNEKDFAGYQKKHNITIDGLIGAAFLDKYNCVVDFRKHKLIIL